jgi:myo-inositol-1(or 4)-monophosphatase
MDAQGLEELRAFACGLAAVAAHIATAVTGPQTLMRKADDSEVTEIDLRIQRTLSERISRRFPDHAVLGEEAGDYLAAMPNPATTRWCWVIDPLDGTRNFVRRLPCFATSIALLDHGSPAVGVVGNVSSGETYSAIRGGGARRGDRLMQTADNPFSGRTIVAFQPDEGGQAFDMAAQWFRHVILRNFGSTALHLAMLADGNVDGGLSLTCHLWDIAAGALLVEESGGRITDLDGRPIFPFNMAGDVGRATPFLAGGPATHASLVKTLCR